MKNKYQEALDSIMSIITSEQERCCLEEFAVLQELIKDNKNMMLEIDSLKYSNKCKWQMIKELDNAIDFACKKLHNFNSSVSEDDWRDSVMRECVNYE